MTLTYVITETENNDKISEDKLLEIYNTLEVTRPEHESEMVIYYDYYDNNTIKSLTKIIDYYRLTKKKMSKDEIVQSIVLFELDEQNNEIVEKRKRLWDNITELKNDDYFSKFILFDP